jgi:2-methylcitrate dehydratase PrpD
VTSPDERLATWVAGLRAAGLPESVRAGAGRFLLDAIASGYAGRTTADRPAIEALARATFGRGDATVIGGAPLAPAGAAFLNGFQVTAATVCDVHRPTLTHVTPEVVPAALVVAERLDAPGPDLLAALVAGFEVTVRVAEALDGEAHRERAWHNPGIAGAIGAAAAVARLHRLDVTGVRHALGHAASQAAGTFAALGTSGVKIHQARGALSGLLAGELAASGVDAAADGLTAARGGLLAAYADGGTPGRLTDGLGERWAFEGIAMRRWPAASSLQPVIAATLDARDALGVEAVRARVDLPPRAHALNAAAGWTDQLSALQSARWIVAVVLADGECWVEQTAPARLRDPAVGRFARGCVDVQLDPSLPLAAARVTLTSADGRSVERRVDVPPGEPGTPLDEAAIEAKLGRATAGSDAAERVDATLSALTTLLGAR